MIVNETLTQAAFHVHPSFKSLAFGSFPFSSLISLAGRNNRVPNGFDEGIEREREKTVTLERMERLERTSREESEDGVLTVDVKSDRS